MDPNSWVPRPDLDTQSRIERALSQRMFLVDRLDAAGGAWGGEAVRQRFSVLGSTGNVYTVTIGDAGNSCTCPDNSRSRGRCKHALFVLLKVLKVPADHPLLYQRSLRRSELRCEEEEEGEGRHGWVLA